MSRRPHRGLPFLPTVLTVRTVLTVSTVLTALTVLTVPAAAQYFGQNKDQYEAFDFKIIATEHFDVYLYERERAAATDIARMAEGS
jgi:hypothetical protein